MRYLKLLLWVYKKIRGGGGGVHVCVYTGSSSVPIFIDKQLYNCISQNQPGLSLQTAAMSRSDCWQCRECTLMANRR